MRRLLAVIIAVAVIVPAAVLARTPNDPEVQQWAYRDVKALAAWDKVTGSRDVVVAVIDNGFDTFHPEIYPNAWKNEDEIPDNGIDDDQNGYIDDVWGWNFSGVDKNGDGLHSEEELTGNNDPRPVVVDERPLKNDIHHGTLVAGIIGAVGNNNSDGAGINWRVRLMNLKVLEVDGVGDLLPLARAIRYAADNGADVINVSLVGNPNTQVAEAVKYAYGKGVAVISAAGNSRVALNVSPVYPVCVDAGKSRAEQLVLGVSAINEGHYLAPFSNVGSQCIDLTAPGVNISSTLRYAPRHGLTERYGGGWQGTSFAAPFVSAAAALIKSIQPSWGPKEIYHTILSTVHRTPPTDHVAYENLFGAGLLQIDKAVEFALSKLPKSHVVSALLRAELGLGRLSEAGARGQERASIQLALKQVHDVASYHHGFATYRQVTGNVGEVVLYDQDWVMQGHWPVAAEGVQDIVVGNVWGDDEAEVVLAPTYREKSVARIFSLAGRELQQFSIASSHQGVSLGLIDAGNKKQDILSVYNDGDGARLRHFDQDFSLMRAIPVDFIEKTGAVTAGDIDGDGVQEYVVGGGAGDVPFLAYYESDGSLKLKFYAYSPSYRGGIELAVGDDDRDGKDDVIAAPKAGGQPVRVWSDGPAKLAEWEMPGDEVRVLAVYR